MKIETTAQEIRTLLQLAQLEAQEQDLPPEAYRSRRETSRRRVAKALLERYEALLEADRYPAIVAIDRGNCSGCHVRLPTMVEYQARRSASVHTCPHCRRMVYAPEHVGERSSHAAASEKKAGPRSQAPAGERT